MAFRLFNTTQALNAAGALTWANNGLFTAKWTEILTETYT